MRAVLAGVALAALFCAPMGALAQAKDGYDFDAAGGAASLGPMYGGVVDTLAGWCSEELPTTAGEWRDIREAWHARNAPWVAASHSVRDEAFVQLRAEGEDPARVKAAFETIVDEFLDKVLADAKDAAEQDGAAAACERFAGIIEGRAFDVERMATGNIAQMLRKHLPKTP